MSELLSFGYIDPSVMTYAIQAGAGIVIAVGAFVGLYFRKAKKKVSNKMGIDENKNKEVESDEIVVKKKEDSKEDSEKKTETKKTEAKKKTEPKKTTTKKKTKSKSKKTK